MSRRTSIVEAYFDGFRSSDHEQILSLLTEDVVWNIHGHTRLVGREAFDGEIENEAFEGSPTLDIEVLIEGSDHVVAPHEGRGRLKGGGEFHFAGCTVLSFDGDLISRVDSYIVPLPAVSESASP
jgi:ketosteroid isomerase-like protein